MPGDGEPPEIGADKPEPNRSEEFRARRNGLRDELGTKLDAVDRLKNTITALLPQEGGAKNHLTDLLASTRESAEGATDIAWTLALEDAGFTHEQILNLWDRRTANMDFETQIDEPEEPKQE